MFTPQIRYAVIADNLRTTASEADRLRTIRRSHLSDAAHVLSDALAARLGGAMPEGDAWRETVEDGRRQFAPLLTSPCDRTEFCRLWLDRLRRDGMDGLACLLPPAVAPRQTAMLAHPAFAEAFSRMTFPFPAPSAVTVSDPDEACRFAEEAGGACFLPVTSAGGEPLFRIHALTSASELMLCGLSETDEGELCGLFAKGPLVSCFDAPALALRLEGEQPEITDLLAAAGREVSLLSLVPSRRDGHPSLSALFTADGREIAVWMLYAWLFCPSLGVTGLCSVCPA